MILCGGNIGAGGPIGRDGSKYAPISRFLVLVMASSPIGSCCNIGMPQGPTSPLAEAYVTED